MHRHNKEMLAMIAIWVNNYCSFYNHPKGVTVHHKTVTQYLA